MNATHTQVHTDTKRQTYTDMERCGQINPQIPENRCTQTTDTVSLESLQRRKKEWILVFKTADAVLLNAWMLFFMESESETPASILNTREWYHWGPDFFQQEASWIIRFIFHLMDGFYEDTGYISHPVLFFKVGENKNKNQNVRNRKYQWQKKQG